MATQPPPTSAPRQRCPNCTEALRARDRFCPACGARLERPDLRAEATPPPPYDIRAHPTAAMTPGPPATPAVRSAYPAVPPAPVAAARQNGSLAFAAGALVLALTALVVTVMLVVTSGDRESRPELVTAPQTLTLEEATR